VPDTRPAAERWQERTRAPARSRAGGFWLVQAVTGALLLVFLAVHLVAQHILAPGGLRDYAAVVAYLGQPVTLAVEIGLLASVVVHACLGIRSSLVDVLGGAGLRRASIVIAAAGVACFGYGIWLTIAILT
jgi:succinate dehydrogenase hydrophobic anchor subunit